MKPLPDTMQAVALCRFGGTDALAVETPPLPEIAPPPEGLDAHARFRCDLPAPVS